MYKIKNVTDKARWCQDKLIDAGETIEVKDDIYVKMARLSPKIFEIETINKKVKDNGSK